jgi:hypothetical protein
MKRIILLFASLSLTSRTLVADLDYVSEFQRATRARNEAMCKAIQPVLERYRMTIEPFLRTATQAGDLDNALRIKSALQSTAGTIEILGRWHLENLSDGHKATLDLNADRTFFVDATRIGVWDVQGNQLILTHDNRGGHQDHFDLPIRDGKLTGGNTVGHTVTLERDAAASPLAARESVREADRLPLPAKEALTTKMPHFYCFEYEGEPQPGKRYWLRVNESIWIERYPDGLESKFKVVSHARINDTEGTMVVKISGDEARTFTDNDGGLQAFIPDKGSEVMHHWYRNTARGDEEWNDLGPMLSVE